MLRDVVSSLDLSVYPTIAMVLFIAVFCVVSFRAIRAGKTGEHDQVAQLPLREDVPELGSGEAAR